jgi:Fic family protein
MFLADKLRFPDIEIKKQKLDEVRSILPTVSVESYEQAFLVDYTHNSTAIEGNTLSLIETKVLLEDKISIGGKPLREIYEITNHADAYKYALQCIAENKILTEHIVKDMHQILMRNIIDGGIYRNVEVRISGAGHAPPAPVDMFYQVKDFFHDLVEYGKTLDPIVFASWTHAEFVKIHPFVDGNGRVSRMMMNYQLLASGLLPVSIPKTKRFEYYDALESYALNGDIEIFARMIAELEEARLDDYLNLVDKGE